jgi:aminoglycoside phosphotransferase (APT) family kinase protein
MHGTIDTQLTAPEGPGAARLASDDELRAWVEAAIGGKIVAWHPISGGNRCRSWAVELTGAAPGRDKVYLRYQPPRAPSAEPYTVWREARIYAAIRDTAVPAPRLLAVHRDHQAIVTELSPGKADYRRLTDQTARLTVIQDFVRSLAALHALPLSALKLPGYRHGMSIKDCVTAELDTWRAMYEEVGRPEPLVAVALDWLYANLPDPAGAPSLVHGDAGPGNFLFHNGRMSALLDWELAHPGDPMEDLAWFSMRAVMEPAPDFPARIEDYASAVGAPVDLARIRYHRVFVSTRVVIIRHRNVTGEPGNSIVSRSLNRRLLIEALA